MPYIYETIRDFITINAPQFRALFVLTNKDLTQTDDAELLANEQTSINRSTLTFRYTSNPLKFTKTLIFEPVSVSSSADSQFNTILITANNRIIVRYQLNTIVNVSPGIPAIISLGSVEYDFDDLFNETQEP